TGEFSDKDCTVGSTEGKYELIAGVGKGKAFKGKSTGPVAFLSKSAFGLIPVECGGSKDAGKAVMPNRVAGMTITFSHCKSVEKVTCTSPGASAGEIRTAVLAGELGYIDKSVKHVGLDLANEATPGGVLGEIECPGLFHVKSIGSVIG